MKPLVFVSVMLLVVAAACERETAPIPEETYVLLLAEMELLKGMEQISVEQPETAGMFQEIILAYGYTPEAFKSAHTLYQNDLEGQKQRMVQVLEILNAYQGELDRLLKDERARRQAAADSLNAEPAVSSF